MHHPIATSTAKPCPWCRVPLLTVIGVLVVYGSAWAVDHWRVNATEARLDVCEHDLIETRLALAEMKYIRAAVERIEAKLDQRLVAGQLPAQP